MIMKKYYYIMIACLGLLTMQAQTTKNGTHRYSLTDIDHNNLPDWIENDFGKGALSGPTGAERYTSEGIVLTKKRTGFSGFAITDLDLDLRKGAKIEFEYAMAGVTGSDGAGYGYGGGGMTFFLYDATEEFSIGYLGSGLGYSFNGSTAGGSTAIKSGLKGGYLGIGFDLDGGNKERKGFGMTSYETREGLSERRYENADFKDEDGDTHFYNLGRPVFGDYYKNHITLRGAGQGDYKGNPLLLTKLFGGEYSGDDIAKAELDYDTGEYEFGTSYESDEFNIADGGLDYNPNFQKIEVELVPDDEDGMFITIKGNGNILIDEFYYRHSFTTYGDGRIDNGRYEDDEYDFETRIPDRVNIGFAGTTMDNNTQKTIIRNVKVSPIDDDGEEGIDLDDTEKQICVSDRVDSYGARTIIKILEDTDYDVDWDSFRFVNANGDEIGEHEHADFYAKWEYDSYYEEVVMTVQYDFFNPGEDLEVYYSIEIDGVRSQPAIIRVKGIACGAIANPHIKTGDKNAPFLD